MQNNGYDARDREAVERQMKREKPQGFFFCDRFFIKWLQKTAAYAKIFLTGIELPKKL